MHSGAEVRAPGSQARNSRQGLYAEHQGNHPEKDPVPCAMEDQAPTETPRSQRAMVEVETTKDKAPTLILEATQTREFRIGGWG